VDEHRIIIERREPVHVFWLLVAACIVVAFWKWFVLGIVIGAVVSYAVWRFRKNRQRINGLKTRAVQQDQWFLQGDDRGIYGEWKGDEGSGTPFAQGSGSAC